MGAENRGHRMLILALATWGGVGFLPFMPGTWGTLAALPLWYHLAQSGPWGYGLGVAALMILGLRVAGPAQEYFGAHGPPGHRGGRSGGPLDHPGRRPPHLGARGPGPDRLPDPGHPETRSPSAGSKSGGKGGLEVMADDVAAGVIGPGGRWKWS